MPFLDTRILSSIKLGRIFCVSEMDHIIFFNTRDDGFENAIITSTHRYSYVGDHFDGDRT